MNIDNLIDNFFCENTFSKATELTYRTQLRWLFDWMTTEKLSFGQLDGQAFKRYLSSKNWGDASNYTASCAAKSFVRWKFGDKHKLLKVRVKRAKVRRQRTFTKDQVEKILAGLDTTTERGIRELAILSLIIDSGMRKCEICRSNIHDLDLDRRRLQIEIKGGSWEYATFSRATLACLQNWLVVREKILIEMNRRKEQHIFLSVGGPSRGKPLTDDALDHSLQALGVLVEIQNSAHDFRRTFATLGSRNGAPDRILQVAGRWKNREMLERYTQAIEAEDMDPWFPMSRIMDCGDK